MNSGSYFSLVFRYVYLALWTLSTRSIVAIKALLVTELLIFKVKKTPTEIRVRSQQYYKKMSKNSTD